jgi:chaperonin GroEL
VAVKAPSFGDRRKEILEDIAILTGATVITEDKGLTFENVDLDAIGSARKVIVGKDSTTIIEGQGRASDVKARISQINQMAENSKSEYDKEQYIKRAAALSGQVAVIKVGGATETEIDEKKFRVDDAVAAAKAALAEGIVPGGGVTLVNLSDKIIANGSDSINAGRQILKNALKQPFLQITANAGLNSEALLSQVESGQTGFGVNVSHPEKGLIDVKKDGIIDPTRVVREAVQNAVSIASTAATMGALVVDLPEPKAPVTGAGLGDMGY